MSPLVKKFINVENDTTTFSKDKVEHVSYVPPDKVRPGDVVVEPSSPRQLAELAEQYPEEFGEEAAAQGVTPGATDPASRAAKIVGMNAKDASAEIGELDADTDSALLWMVYELEKARGEDEDDPADLQPRQTVLAALERKGITDGDGPE